MLAASAGAIQRDKGDVIKPQEILVLGGVEINLETRRETGRCLLRAGSFAERPNYKVEISADSGSSSTSLTTCRRQTPIPEAKAARGFAASLATW